MKRLTWGAWIGSIGVCLMPWSVLQGQTAPGSSVPSETRPTRPRSAVETGIDYHLKGEYETAEAIFAEAVKYEQYLSSEEKSKLADYMKRNKEALAGRRAALQQLVQVDEAVRSGRLKEADTLLKSLRASKYLNTQERQQVVMLGEQYKQKGGSSRHGVMDWMSKDSNPKQDTDAMVAEARRALERGDTEQAEIIAKEAEQAGHKSLFPWSDSPAKVLKDVQTTRAKMPPRAVASQQPMPPAGPPVGPKENKSARARDLLKQAHEAAQVGDTMTAKKLVAQAEALKVSIPWWEEHTVDKVKQEIAKAEQKPTKASVVASAGTPPVPPPSALPPAPPGPSAVTSGSPKPAAPSNLKPFAKASVKPAEVATVKPTEMASGKPTETASVKPAETPAPTQQKMTSGEVRALVKQAREACERGEYDRAETMAKQARVQTGVKYGLFEDTPDKVLADAIKGRDAGKDGKAAEVLADARRKMEAGQYDEAEKLTYQAEAMRPTYPIWYRGERHDKIRQEIIARRKANTRTTLPPLLDPVTAKASTPKPPSPSSVAVATPRPPSPDQLMTKPGLPGIQSPYQGAQPVDPQKLQAMQTLAQARESLSRGEFHVAVQLAGQAKMTGVQFGPNEDSPEAILAAVKAVQDSSRDRQNPAIAEAAKKQALQCLADARLLHKEGRLIEAWQCALQAKKVGAAYGPNEDTPDAVLATLKQSAATQYRTYSDAANTLVERGQHQEAERYWRYVFQLGTTYGMDTSAVGVEIAKAQKMSAGTASASAGPIGEGEELFAQAERELARGDLVKARQFANALYTGPFNMKDKARDVLARVDDAEHKSLVKRTHTAFDLGVRAYVRKDYAVAASYLQSIDLRLLVDDKRAYAQEILASKEMQPHSLVAQATGTTQPTTDDPEAGKQTATDQPPRTIDPQAKPQPTLVDEVRKRQALEFQRLRQEAITSQQQANKLAGAGDLDSACETLSTAIAAVKGSGLDPDQVSPLLKQLEDRHRKFSVMREQVALTNLTKQKMQARLDGHQQKLLFEESKKEQVSDFMKKYSAYMKEGKYNEAYVMAQKAHELDPDAPATEVAVFKANVMRNLSDDKAVKESKDAGFGSAMRDVARASGGSGIDDTHPVSYSEDWKERTRNRGLKKHFPVQPITPQDREVNSKLNTVVSFDCKNKPLVEVLNELRTLTNVNIVPDQPYIEADGISLEQPVSIRLDNLPLKTVLTRILHNAKLTYAVRDGVLLVTTPAGQRGKLYQIVHPVADLISATDRFTPPDPLSFQVNGMKSITEGMSNAGANLQWSKTSPGMAHEQVMTERGQDPRAKPQRRPGQSMEELLMRLIKDTIEPASWDDMGGSGHIDYYPLGMSLIVSQTPDIQEQIQQLLERLRELQDVQVTVEVRFITLTENFYERIGIDFDVEIDDDQTRFDKMVAANTFAAPGLLNEPDHLDNVIVGLTPTGNFTSDLDIPINTSSFNLATPPFGGFPNSPGANGGIDLGVAFLSSIEVYLFMEAAQGDSRTNVLTSPKVTLFNGQTANLTSSTEQFFVTQVIPITNPFTGFTTFLPVNTPFPTAVSLTVQAVVTADRRYVQLTLNPTITRTTSGGTFMPVPGITLQQPTVDLLSVGTTVSVPDGGTILLGGLKTMSEGRNEFGPPVLSKIPYINRLFKNIGYGRESESLMIMVTPRIIIPEEEEERLGQTFAF